MNPRFEAWLAWKSRLLDWQGRTEKLEDIYGKWLSREARWREIRSEAS